MAKYSRRILLIRLYALNIFSVQAKILLTTLYNKTTLKSAFFCVRLKVFSAITEYEELFWRILRLR
jgi:hypothetical protein